MQRATYLPIQQGGLYQAPCCTPTCVRKPLFRPAWLSKKDLTLEAARGQTPSLRRLLLSLISTRIDEMAIDHADHGFTISWPWKSLAFRFVRSSTSDSIFHSAAKGRGYGNVQCLSSCTLSLELTWQRTTVGGTNSTESCVAASERTKEHKLFH